MEDGRAIIELPKDEYERIFGPISHKFADYFAGKTIPNADHIRALPTTEIVRCRDCMYSPSGTDDEENKGCGLEWPYDDWPEDNPCPCKCEDGWYSHKPKRNFFCANGIAVDAIEEDADELR